MISPIVGRKFLQPVYKALYQFSLLGMNIGAGANPKISGEKSALNYVRRHFKSLDKIVIFDVGANAGHYSVLAKEVFGDKALIYSFEPSVSTFKKLTANIGNTPGITLHQFGLGDQNTKTSLFSNSAGSGLASVYHRKLDHYDVQMNEQEEVELKTLDSFCESQGINHIHFLKLDVEGHEKKVIEGSLRMLQSGAIDFIQFEFGGCNIDSRTYFQDFYYLLKDNFHLYRILKDGLYPITRYKEELEAFTTTNFLAQKK